MKAPIAPIRTKALWVLLLACLIGTTACTDRLVPDQVMIDNLQKNKPAFEELVNSYLHFPPPNNGEWDQLLRVMELKQVTGVARITNGPVYWFDDPYSLEVAQKLREIDQNNSWRQHHDRNKLTFMNC